MCCCGSGVGSEDIIGENGIVVETDAQGRIIIDGIQLVPKPVLPLPPWGSPGQVLQTDGVGATQWVSAQVGARVAYENMPRAGTNTSITNVANRVWISQWLCPADFVLRNIGVQSLLSWGAAQATVGIYAHWNAQLLRSSAQYTSPTGIYVQPITPLQVTGGELYWLAYKLDAVTGSFGGMTTSNISGVVRYGTYAPAGLPPDVNALLTGSSNGPYFGVDGTFT